MPRLDVEALKRGILLSSLIAPGLPLKKRGARYWGCCPFHAETTPSFEVRDDAGTAHCFGCGWHGDHVSWLMQIEKLTFTEAVERLGGTVGDAVARPYRDAEARRNEVRARSMEHWSRAVPLEHGYPAMWLRVACGLKGPFAGLVRWIGTWRGRGPPPLVAQVTDSAGEPAGLYLNRVHGTIGRCRDGAVRLAEARPVMALTSSLVGALWVHERYGVPCWCALCEARLAKVRLPEECRELTIFAGEGDLCWRLAMNAADRHETPSRSVVIERLGERIREQYFGLPEPPPAALQGLDPDQVAGG